MKPTDEPFLIPPAASALDRPTTKKPPKQSTTELTTEQQTDCTAILSELKDKPWRSTKQLRSCVQQSLVNVSEFRRKLALVQLPDELLGVRDCAYDVIGLDRDYILGWWLYVWEQTHNWKQWSGDLRSYIWHDKHELFVASLADRVAKYRGYSDRSVDKLLTAVRSQKPPEVPKGEQT